MINCYSWLNKPDSSYVVSWLHSVLFPLLGTLSKDDDDGSENVGKKNEVSFFQT